MKTILNGLNHEIFALTTTYKGKDSAMIATWVMPATFAKGKIRIMAALSVSNFTTDLILKRKRFVLHLLSKKNLNLVPLLGLYSTREIDKLSELKCTRTPSKIPILPNTCGWIECELEGVIDGGDRLIIIAKGVRSKLHSKEVPLNKKEAYSRLESGMRRSLEEKYVHDSLRDQKLFRKIN